MEGSTQVNDSTLRYQAAVNVNFFAMLCSSSAKVNLNSFGREQDYSL